MHNLHIKKVMLRNVSPSRYFAHRLSHCTRLGLQLVHTRDTLEIAAHQRKRPVSHAQLANQESDMLSTSRQASYKPVLIQATNPLAHQTWYPVSAAYLWSKSPWHTDSDCPFAALSCFPLVDCLLPSEPLYLSPGKRGNSLTQPQTLSKLACIAQRSALVQRQSSLYRSAPSACPATD